MATRPESSKSCWNRLLVSVMVKPQFTFIQRSRGLRAGGLPLNTSPPPQYEDSATRPSNRQPGASASSHTPGNESTGREKAGCAQSQENCALQGSHYRG